MSGMAETSAWWVTYNAGSSGRTRKNNGPNPITAYVPSLHDPPPDCFGALEKAKASPAYARELAAQREKIRQLHAARKMVEQGAAQPWPKTIVELAFDSVSGRIIHPVALALGQLAATIIDQHRFAKGRKIMFHKKGGGGWMPSAEGGRRNKRSGSAALRRWRHTASARGTATCRGAMWKMERNSGVG